jgi:hypothetical protein
MAKKKIKFERIKAKLLYTFSRQIYASAQNDDLIPIGKCRALAFANNPCAGNDDIGLLTAYLDNKCIGYLGMMPGWLRIKDTINKVYWLSTWYVPPKFRKISVGISLILEARALNYDLIVCGMSAVAKKVYKALRFKQLGVINFYQIKLYLLDPVNLTFRLVRKIIRHWKDQFEIPYWLIRISKPIYYPINKLLLGLISSNFKIFLEDVVYKEVSEIPKHSTIDEDLDSVGFYRNHEILNWMLKYKWTTTKDKLEKKDYNYFFAEIRDEFKFTAMEVYSKNEESRKGFLILSFSIESLDRILKILDFRFSNTEDYSYILPIAFKYAEHHLANMIEIPQELYEFLPANRITKFVTQEKERTYLVYPKNKKSPLYDLDKNNLDLSYCDGDMAFT